MLEPQQRNRATYVVDYGFPMTYSSYHQHVPNTGIVTKKRQRDQTYVSVDSTTATSAKKKKNAVLLSTPIQLSKLLNTPDMKVGTLVVPTNEKQYISARSSKKHTVWLPLWIQLNGVTFEQIPVFPGLISGERYSAGAQGCVAAYRCSDPTMNLPDIALKAVPMFSSRKRNRTSYSNRKSTWSCEWKVHEYIQQQNFCDVEPSVDLYGGLCASVHGLHQIFFAMELMDKDLFTVIEENTEDGKWLIQVLLSTAKALKALHDCGIIYCDLKPENILVRSDGLAKFGDFDRSCVPELKLGIIGGTKGYESPERVVDSMCRSVEDDIWAFGVTILIAGTMASSPYAEFSLEDFNRFVPSVFLETQCRKDWTVTQVRYLGALCDQILKVNPSERASLDFIIIELERILTLDEYPSTSHLMMRAASSDGMVGLGLPLTDLTREHPVSNSTVLCSASTASSDRYTNVFIPEVDSLDDYLAM